MKKKISYFLLTKSIGLYINMLRIISSKKAFQLAYALFSEPRKGRLSKENLPKVLQEAQTQTYNHKNQQFQTYTWQGNDTTILLVHGWESNASRWENLLPFLRKSGSTVIAIDAPAHGLSDGKEFSLLDYAEFIRIVAENTKPEYLIGHSLGGKTCLYYQSIYQNQSIKKIVTLGSPCDFFIIFQNFINLLSINSKTAADLEQHYLTNFNVNLREFSVHLYASKLTTTGLIAHDIEDTIVLFKEGKKIADVWKNSVFIETKGLGHSMHSDDLYEKVSAFLFETE